MDYYSILGINKQASQDEIKKAYRKSAMKHHPDHGGDGAKFSQINEAYETLRILLRGRHTTAPKLE